ncbi:hypothetical protein [Paenibacillus thermotolerans]|uniref:hypothetical protein n=1 Tax=Paenibacillus thermotolerans TaxID=3027807 RepID=UPI002368B275|nr:MULTISPECIES: hypothetical protein [unclassified Paenibacillus]
MFGSICPVCNGFEQLVAACPQCGAKAEDQGKLSDLYGPYSPYRPIDDLKLTNGYDDLAHRQCMHAVYCPVCGETAIRSVNEV